MGPGDHDPWVGVNGDHLGLHREQVPVPADAPDRAHHRFEPDAAVRHPGGAMATESSVASPAAVNLSGSNLLQGFSGGGGFEPVNGASASTAFHRSDQGKPMPISRSLRTFAAVCPFAPRPRTTVRPSAQKLEIGARLTVPSRLRVVSSATGFHIEDFRINLHHILDARAAILRRRPNRAGATLR